MPVIGRAIDETNGQVIQALVGKVIAVTGGIKCGSANYKF
jgi:hypothetical protein